jgi:ribosomal protein S18 acetylase RimI-like enzyme
MIEIFEITESDDSFLLAVNHLLPQLSKSAQPISLGTLQTLASSESTRLIMAREGNAILGMLSLVVFAIPTGMKAWVEDVVVEKESRGKGVGKKLMMYAMVEAKKAGAKSVDLTSRPSREAANQLYQAIGFKVRETNVYRHHSKC